MKRLMLALLASTALAVIGSAAQAADMQARPITKAPILTPVGGFEGWYLGDRKSVV